MKRSDLSLRSMKRRLYYKIMLFTILLFTSAGCGLDENPPYDLKFFHIMHKDISTVTVSAEANFTATYTVYRSAPASDETVVLNYEIVVGNGLQSEVDFQVITTGNSLTFLPGIYDMPIRIKWIARAKGNPLDPTKDNTLKIKLISNDKGYSIGLPGPAHNQSTLTITKR